MNDLRALERSRFLMLNCSRSYYAWVYRDKMLFKWGRRMTLESPEERPSINSPADVAVLVQFEKSALEQEELRVILLNTRNRVQKIETIYQGSLNTSKVQEGEIFKVAIRINAAAIIVVHNHRSGDPTPSPGKLPSRAPLSSPGVC